MGSPERLVQFCEDFGTGGWLEHILSGARHRLQGEPKPRESICRAIARMR